MDYDDNDFQSQNFQLIGEDNDGFPQSLHLQSYAPPKFDIDDHFQHHIRFDNIGDTGLLLGIPGEENNWIEEFSPRNSAVEFGSSAAQTCSISGLDNIWSNAPSSESAQMLVKSVGNGETVGPQVMNSTSETNVIDDSANSGTNIIAETDSTVLTDKFHKSSFGSHEDVLRAEQLGFSQNPNDENSEMGLDASLPDQNFHTTGKVVAFQCNTNEELTSSSSEVSKACLVDGELLEVVQSNEPLDNAPKRNCSLDAHGCAVNWNTEASPKFLSCSTQDGPLGLSTENAGINIDKLDNPLFSEKRMEECYEFDMSERSEALPYENKKNETSCNLYGHCKVNDQHSQGHALNNVCDVKDSSGLVSSSDSLMLPNEGSTNSVIFKNSNEAIDYQVKVLIEDLRMGDKCSTCTKEVPSLAVERDGSTGRNSVEVGTERIPELCDVAGPTDFSHGVHECISKDDDLLLHAPSTKESKIISFEEVRVLATSKAVIDENNCRELRNSSDMEVKVELGASLEAEITTTRVDADTDRRIDPLSSKYSDPVQVEKTAEDESLKAITEKSTRKLYAPEHAILKEPCVSLPEDAENRLSSSVHDKLAPMSDASPLVAELKEDNKIHSEESSTNSDPVQMINIAEDESVKAITKKSSRNLDASGHTILKEPCSTSLEENKLSSSVHNNIAALSDTSSLVAELKEDNVIHLEEMEHTAQLIDSSGTNSNDCNTGTENTELSSVEAQNAGVVMDSDKKSIMDQAGGVKLPFPNNSTILQQLRSEVEEIVERKEAAVSSIPASCCNEKDVSTNTQIQEQSLAVADSDVDCSSTKKFSDGLETVNNDEVRLASSAGFSSLATCQSTEGKDANLDPTINCDNPSCTVTEMDALNGDRNNLPPSALPGRNLECCLMDPEGGNPTSFEPNCGSPTVISCNERTLEEIEHRESKNSLPDPAGPTSETTENSDSLKYTVQGSKASTTSEDDGNFTFVVQPAADVSQKDTIKNWELFCNMQSFKQSQISKENSQEHQDETTKETTGTNSKTTEEDKKKQVSARATRKGGISKGDAKEKSQEKHSRGRKKSLCSTPPVLDRATVNKTHMEGIPQCLYVETNTTKSSCSPSIQTSNLPDLNNSVAAVLFNQPFTDLQQVQLRAQIFVYGSLIQGILPDEACMIAAFGGTDGGRSLWGCAWHAASERFHNQKSSPSSCGMHLHYHSGISCSPLPSKTLTSPAGWRESNFLNSAMQISTALLQSPFQSSSNDGLPSSITRSTHLESNQSPSPLHSYLTSQARQDLSNSTPSVSQSPCPPSSFTLQSSPFASTTQCSAMPVAETAQVTPVRESSVPLASNMQLASPGSALPNPGSVSVSAALVVPVETQNRASTPASTTNASVSERSRKRKKASAPEQLLSKFSVSQPQAVSASAAVITSYIPASAGLSLTSNSSSAITSAGLVSAASHLMTLPYYQNLGSGDTQQRVIFSTETSTQIKHSKLQAENASAYAAVAVRHSQVTWAQMTAHRKSGLTSEAKEKLASAAVAAAAAASVAKAAAEAAKVAAEAAIQAKFMADEALNSAKTGRTTQNSEVSTEIGKNLMTSTPVSIPKGKDKICGSCSIVSTALETSKKGVEAPSAVIKRAENFDAILKAAEMAAEAISQAGTVIGMGDPLPFSLSELVEAGPEGHWKLHCAVMGNGAKSNNVQAGENLGLGISGDHEIIAKQPNEKSSNNNETQKVDVNEMPLNYIKPMLLNENYGGNGSQTTLIDTLARDPIQGSSIQKESFVEVVVDEDGLGGAWFSAWVLDVKDGKAQVCYKDRFSDKGYDKLKEWIPLESQNDKPPRIRAAHPVTIAKSDGTRKRRRGLLGNCTWAVGDRVDAWIGDGWWEGIVTEKSQDDETKLTVHFPVRGDSSVVRAWNLRHALIWKDDQWVERSHDKERVTLESYEGDTPNEKRQKLGQLDAQKKPEIDEGEMGTLSRNSHTDDSGKLKELRPHNLSAKVVLSVERNVGEENNTNEIKERRADLQKNGSRMVFGVPKPGKKRKFMEVSKHYIKDKTERATERSDPVKFGKTLMPQASQLWRNISKVNIKEKWVTNLNARAPKSLRSQSVKARTNGDKEKLSVSAVSVVADGGGSSLRTFSSEEKKSSGETVSFSHVLEPVIESSVQPIPGIPSSKKKSSAEFETGEKGKVLSDVDKSSRSAVEGSENPGKRSADVIEPRRSNRRIQPTSRLLEGLQSSLIISKSTSVLHDRGVKTLQRGVTTSRGQSHG